MFGKLFKPRAHYVFDYKPRFYNERKERLRNLEEKYHGNKDKTNQSSKITLTKNNLKNDWVKSKRSATNKSSNLRLAIIIAILVGIAAYILDLHTLF
ncbi:hypothetical protein Lupro_00535 [Lutibacter profundi]|uniref:Riboflavin synthase subunit beta n=1 Tax=Lutibacter profundi TaxID=1622118 RepID=A0A0X8G4E5_9FLAO|nr:hypothetical protein [Lutibacter profundi]AMC09839.1 hypothetical protein Lupro_00535 [Lutibacter profundi]